MLIAMPVNQKRRIPYQLSVLVIKRKGIYPNDRVTVVAPSLLRVTGALIGSKSRRKPKSDRSYGMNHEQAIQSHHVE